MILVGRELGYGVVVVVTVGSAGEVFLLPPLGTEKGLLLDHSEIQSHTPFYNSTIAYFIHI
jgi:hypothetical protein